MTKQPEPNGGTALGVPVTLAVKNSAQVNWPGRHIAPVYQDALKAIVRTPDFFDHCCKEGHKRFALQGWADISERYLAGSVYLCIGIVWSDSSIGVEVGKHYAIVKVAGATAHNSHESAPDRKMTELGYVASGTDRNQLHMLVDVSHSENSPENLVTSIVRMCSEDSLSQIAIEIAEKSNSVPMLIEGPAVTSEIAPAIPSGELDLFGVDGFSAQTGKSNSGLVQSGAQLVNEFSSQDVHDFWRVRIQNEFCQFVSGLRFRIENDPTRVLLKELPLGAFKLDEMVICAL